MRRIIIFLAFLLLALPALGTTVIPMSVERLAQASEFVVEGQAGQSWSAWNPEHTMVFTYTRFQVTHGLKGATAQSIVVKQMGGHAGGYFVKVAGVRNFQAGEESVLFLHLSLAADGTYVITGLMQGNFRVQREAGQATVSNGVAGISRYGGVSNTISTFEGSHMTLDELETRVRKVVGQ